MLFHPICFETSKYELLKTRLLADYPGLDGDCLLDTLDGITDLHEIIAAVIRSALVDEALQAGLRTRVEEMRQRLTRLAERGLKKRQLALEAMNEAGLKKLEQPDFTASARLGAPPLVVNSERDVPDELLDTTASEIGSTGTHLRSEARR